MPFIFLYINHHIRSHISIFCLLQYAALDNYEPSDATKGEGGELYLKT